MIPTITNKYLHRQATQQVENENPHQRQYNTESLNANSNGTYIKLQTAQMDVTHRLNFPLESHSDLLANKEWSQRLCVKRNPVIEAVNNGPDTGLTQFKGNSGFEYSKEPCWPSGRYVEVSSIRRTLVRITDGRTNRFSYSIHLCAH